MREILFRGKRVDSGEWVYGNLNYGTIEIESIKDSYFISDFNVTPWDKKFYPVISETVGQSTGLTDKNGRKIFEGDILAAPDYPNLKYKVSFANANFCVKCPAQSYLFYLGSRCFDMFGNPEYEIVGNIHDNRELLEVTE